MNSEQPILVSEISETISSIRLNRPERSNAFSLELLRSLSVQLEKINAEPAKRFVILQGSGKSFCGGLDMAEASESRELAYEMSALVSEILVRIRKTDRVMIGLAQGPAYGGGGAILAACDFVLAGESFRIAFPEVHRGLEPALLFPLLRRKLSRTALSRMILSGEPIGPEEAKEYGLVSEIIEGSERDLYFNGIVLVKKLARAEPHALACAKRMIYEQFEGAEFEAEMQLALESHFKSWCSPAASEGVKAFLGKRPGNWSV